MTRTDPPAARRTLFGRRQGKALRSHQAELMRTLLPRLRIPLDAQAAPGSLDPYGLFDPAPRDVWLEIGFGGGEHLIARAQAHPDIGFIGCEPFINGVAKLLGRIEALNLANIRVHDDDARAVIDRLTPASVGCVFLLYPDPWPKKRHHKRRFVNAENLSALARILRPGGTFLFATDIADYADWATEALARHPDFEPEPGADPAVPPPGWPGTRYEQKAMAAGRRPAYLTYRRAGKA